MGPPKRTERLKLLLIVNTSASAVTARARVVIRKADTAKWGVMPFRLGLWVGSKATPNTLKQAAESLRQGNMGGRPGLGGTPHQIFGVDSTPRLKDVFIDPSHNGTPDPTQREWRTVAIGGFRDGGAIDGGTSSITDFVSGYYALDITQPDQLDVHNDPIDDRVVPSCLSLTNQTVSNCGTAVTGSLPNDNIPCPTNLTATTSLVSGKGLPGATIDVFIAVNGVGLKVVDVTSRSAPYIVATLNLPGSASDVKLSGTRAYFAAGAAGLSGAAARDL